MVNRRIIGMMAVLLTASLSLTACGDDSSSNNGNNNGGNDVGADAGMDAAQDGGDMDATEDGGGEDADQGCTSDDDCAPGMMCETDTGACVEAPSGCDLTGDERPARCDQDFAGTTFGPGSLVTSFQIAGRNVGGTADPECCFDYNGDGEIDNSLGGTLIGVSADTFDSLNASLASSIADGSLILAFEHDGLTDLSAGEDYKLNFWLGQLGGVDCSVQANCSDAACANTAACAGSGDTFEDCSTDTDEDGDGDAGCADSDCTDTAICAELDTSAIEIDPNSVDQGTFPQAQVDNAKIDGDKLSAGPGSVKLSIDLLDTPLELVISNAQIEADVDTTQSTIADGIWLTNGKLGGVVRIDDILDGVNNFASTCDCMGLSGDDAISYQANDVAGTAECNVGTTEADACTADGQDSCATIAKNCSLVVNVLPLLADIDTDNDGTNDAVSVGAKFETVGTTFSGIGSAQ